MRPLKYTNDPNFEGVILRRTQEALKKPGSVWPESKKLYRRFETQVNNTEKTHIFPSGSTLKFDGLQLVGDEENNYQGSQLSFVGVDEGTHFEQSQIIYMISRLRSEANSDAFCMITCNPDPDSWLLEWVRWYLDEAGYPVRERGGTIRYFVVVEDEPKFASTKEELIEEYPDACFVEDDEGNTVEVISTYTFIDGNIYDNPALIRNEPKYLAKLKSQSRVNRMRLLRGNWFAREEGSNYFKREWLKSGKPPLGAVAVRAYDKAGTEPSESNKYPDYTACIKMSKGKDGCYYIQGDFHPSFKNDKSQEWGRFQKRVGERDRLIKLQAYHDGSDCKIIFPKDTAQGGKFEFETSRADIVKEGFIVKQDPLPHTTSKLKKFEPFAAEAEHGNVYIDEHSFPNKATLDAFLKELEGFDGERSQGNKHDDFVDCVASAFNYLVRQVVIHNLPFSTGTSDFKPKQLTG